MLHYVSVVAFLEAVYDLCHTRESEVSAVGTWRPEREREIKQSRSPHERGEEYS